MSEAQAPADREKCPICRQGQPLEIIAELDQVWVTAQPEAALPGYVCVVSNIGNT